MKQKRFSEDPEMGKLKDLALQLRRDTIRMISYAGSGHIGGALGLADFMAALYGYAMEFDTEDTTYTDRDRIVLSNGHTCAVWYAALARTGFIYTDELATFRKLGSRLQGHPARRELPEIVETSTGPLGQGFSVANGLALSMKKRKSQGRVYCIIGDGEIQEGQVWEAFMTASHYRLDNLTLFINYNNLQIDGSIEDVMNIAPLDDRLRAFGWNVIKTDGHNMDSLVKALSNAATHKNAPTAIIGETLMGKGVSFMEDKAVWHGTCPSEDQVQQALDELGNSLFFRDYPIL